MEVKPLTIERMKNKNAYQLAKVNRSLATIKDPVVRERLLLLKLYYRGNSLRATADHHRCSHRKVSYWKIRYETKGLGGLATQPKSGAPPKLDPDAARVIQREVVARSTREGGWKVRRIREYIRERAGVTYSVRHTTRLAQDWGLTLITPRPQYVYAKQSDRADFLKEKR